MIALTRIVETASSEFSSSDAKPLPRVRKWPIPYHAIEPLVMTVDAVVILLASLLSALAARGEGDSIDLGKAMGTMILVAALFVCLLKIRGLYRQTALLALRRQIFAVSLAWTSVFVLLAVAVGGLGIGHESPRGAGLFAICGLLVLVALRLVTKQLLLQGLNGNKFVGRNVALVSDQQQTSTVGSERTLELLGCRVMERFSLPPPGAGFGHRKRLSARVIECVRGSDIEEIVIEADPNRWAELRSLIGDLRVLPFPITFVPVGPTAEIFRRPTRDVGNALGVELQRGPLSKVEYASKRMLDVVSASLGLLLLSPLFALAALAIKLESPGPIFFRQQRCGFNGRSFVIHKFRTMTVLEDGQTIVQARKTDPRVTRVGKWLRRSSIDELPQLLNVLDGSMSLVGPRPHALAHDGQFDKAVRNYAFRRRVKPGLTGWAQIHGCRGATPTTEMIERRVQYDIWYIDNWSLRLDLSILLQTPIEVLRARNAY